MTHILTALAAASLGACLWAQAVGVHAIVYIAKPLTTVLLLAVAWYGGGGRQGGAYTRRLVGGLACSVLGDAALMLPGDYFVEGLAAFFVAHLAYIGAFSVRAGGLRPSASALPFAFAYVLLVGRLAPHVGPLLGPVTAYAAVLLMMAWAALEAWRRTPGPATALALVGAVLFVLSDTLFAFGRFVGTWPYQDAEVMLTYVGAQWCLASSTRPLRRSRP